MLKKVHLFLFAAICLTNIIFNSCKKDSRLDQQNTISDPAIAQAKNWYENAYLAGTKLNSLSTASHNDLSQLIKPDWNHFAAYPRYNKQVIEMPVDPSAKFGSALKNMTTSQSGDKSYSRSYFLLMKDTLGYKAYVMTIIADPAYVKNDFTKLANNTYQRHDADFGGEVLYFTPQGKFLNGYTYKNGQLITLASSNQQAGNQEVQSVNDKKIKTNESAPTGDCTDWYVDTYINDVLVSSTFVGTTCSGNGVVGSNSGGTGSPILTAPPCTPTTPGQDVTSSGKTNVNSLGLQVVQDPATPVNPDGSFPPPSDSTNPCTVNSGGSVKVTTPNFGIDANCLNCRVSDANFDDLLNYIDSQGISYSNPYNVTYTVNGVAYQGQFTDIKNPDGTIVHYFSPDVSSGPFQIGTEYTAGTSTTGSNSINTTTNVNIGTIVVGSSSTYLGSGSVTYIPQGGGGNGSIELVADPLNMDWSDEPDNITLIDPNPITYIEYQQTTPWPAIANIIPFSQFVPYRTYIKNGKEVGVNCLTLSKEQIAKMGYTCSGYLPGSQTFQTYTSAKVVDVSKTKQAITYLIFALTNKIPVVAGIDAYPGASNSDGITDHFVTIDGMGTDGGGKFFHFVDNSTNQRASGDNYANKLYYNEVTGIITGKTASGYPNHPGGHDYILTQIRKSIKK